MTAIRGKWGLQIAAALSFFPRPLSGRGPSASSPDDSGCLSCAFFDRRSGNVVRPVAPHRQEGLDQQEDLKKRGPASRQAGPQVRNRARQRRPPVREACARGAVRPSQRPPAPTVALLLWVLRHPLLGEGRFALPKSLYGYKMRSYRQRLRRNGAAMDSRSSPPRPALHPPLPEAFFSSGFASGPASSWTSGGFPGRPGRWSSRRSARLV